MPSWTRLVPFTLLGAILVAQPDLAGRAARLRQLLNSEPRFERTQIILSDRLPDAASLATVSSVAVAGDGTIYALHRPAANSPSSSPSLDPIIAMDRDGNVLRRWGRGLFAVPHSIRVASDGNIWTVDAGSSTILEFTPQGEKLRQIEVGEVATGDRCAFPTLCGTTDIAFGPAGRLFISDGYGNARILEYTRDGRRVRQWGTSGTGPGQFQIPHGVAVFNDIVYVADRTNARIQRFDLDGKYLGEWTHLGRPFALQFNRGSLWVAGMTLEQSGATPFMLKLNPASGELLGSVEAPGPHAIGVNDREELFATGCCGGIGAKRFFVLR